MAHHIIDYVEAFASARPDEIAIVVVGRDSPDFRLTYRELDERLNRAANVLAGLGVRNGDHVGCHLYDTPAHVDVMLGAWKLGAVPINVNFRYVEHELKYLFDDADLRVVVTEPELAAQAEAAAKEVGVEHVIIADDDWEVRLAAASDARPNITRTGDEHYVLYTGGTTGMPKGVVWRQEDIFYAAFGAGPTPALGLEAIDSPEAAVSQAEKATPATERFRHQMPFLPLMHAAGQWAMCRALARGGRCTFIRDVSFDPEYALEIIRREGVNIVWAAGDAHARPILDFIETNHGGTLELPELILWISGAVMLTPALKADILRCLPGTIVIDGLGASETGGQGQGSGYSEEGSPRFVMEEGTLILDDHDRPIPRDDQTIGRLAKGGHIPLGYYKDEAKTAKTFYTVEGQRYAVPGDLARWEPDGTFTLFGRGSVSINTGGEKVFPEEVEKALKTHPAVFDAIVVGTNDERFGKRVTAVVQLRSGHDDPGLEALADHCRGQLAGYKLPRALVIEAQIVRSPSGKPDYRWALEAANAALGT